MIPTLKHTGVAGAVAAIAMTAAVYGVASERAAAGAGSQTVPPPQATAQAADGGQGQAVLAGGCFWGMETVFQHVKGVKNVVSGYAGGPESTATYAASSSGQTNQAETVHIVYDPQQVSYGELLRIYFSVAHDPTQVNRQGPDTGREYRSEIFAVNAKQQKIAQSYIQQLDQAAVFSQPIATKISRIQPEQFYPAESYHQNYAEKHPSSLYIRINDKPKVEALAKHFPDYYTKPIRHDG